LFKFLFRNDGHVHCFCDKVYDHTTKDGLRVIIMACNKCGLQRDYVYEVQKEES